MAWSFLDQRRFQSRGVRTRESQWIYLQLSTENYTRVNSFKILLLSIPKIKGPTSYWGTASLPAKNQIIYLTQRNRFHTNWNRPSTFQKHVKCIDRFLYFQLAYYSNLYKGWNLLITKMYKNVAVISVPCMSART